MNGTFLSDIAALEGGLQHQSSRAGPNGSISDSESVSARSGVGIFVEDAICQRLLESASRHLDLDPVLLSPQDLEGISSEYLSRFELIIANRSYAAHIRHILNHSDAKGEGTNPAIIAVVSSNEEDGAQLDGHDSAFDALLALPQLPAPLAAQLSVILYSHRAFARRYQGALEELHLNRRIFRSVTSGISVANALLPDCLLTYVNPAFEAMTGFSLEEVQGKNCRFLQGAERDQPAIALLREAIKFGREITVVLRNFRKDGSPFWNELSLSPIRSREGQVTHFVGIQTDVTSRVEIEAALRESEKLAAVGRLASTIAHEINNPLESVMNLIYLAERCETMAQTRAYLATADRELQRVKLITTQSLRFFKQSTRPQAVGATALIDSVLDLYQSRLMNAQIAVQRRERSTCTVVCMESEIRQVLNNLVSNAIDAMSMGSAGRRLIVRTRDACDPRTGKPGIVITIADTGSGIAPETIKNIYRAFYTTKGIGGTGLGLWISSEIVERHHGRMIVRSSTSPGAHGTVFALYLPHAGLATPAPTSELSA
jgi:two-component system sporulation sensor kinase C